MLKNKQLMLVTILLLLVNMVQAQTRTISGKVTSAGNEAQPGVSVLVKETLKGTVTDANGKYSISAPAGEVTLVISSIGFDKLEKKVAANATMADFSLV